MASTKRSFVIKATIVATIAMAAVWSFNQANNETSAVSSAYEVKPTDVGNITRSVSASGSVRPMITVEIGSQLSGQIDALYVDYNDEVEAGALLARIDPQSFETGVKQANAQLAVALASVDVQKAKIDRAMAVLEEAERQVARQQELRSQETVSESALDAAVSYHKTAQADLASAKASLKNAEATVAQRQASLDQANIDLSRTEIRSPINGTVIERSVDVGQTVAASLAAPTLFELAQDLSEIQVEADVDEADIGHVKSSNRVEFSVDAYPDRTFAGQVKQIRLAPNETANVVTYAVIITAQNKDRALLPGMTANVEIFTGEKPDVVRIDNSALKFRPSERVDTLAAGRAQRSGPRQLLARLAENLELTEEQLSDLQRSLGAVRAQGANRGGGGSPMGMGTARNENRTQDRVQMRQQMAALLEAALREVLTQEQWARYQVLKEEQADARRALVWVLSEDNTLQPVRIVLGLSDDDNTEVIRGLEAGARVVVRETRPSK